MKTLACPECHEVMHRVDKVTARTEQAGISQLSRHCTTNHVIPAMEAMLAWVANQHYTLQQALDYTQISCYTCGTMLRFDTHLYVRKHTRTIQVCSTRCQREAN
jgi:RNase P subunit RPR2